MNGLNLWKVSDLSILQIYQYSTILLMFSNFTRSILHIFANIFLHFLNHVLFLSCHLDWLLFHLYNLHIITAYGVIGKYTWLLYELGSI